MVRTRQADDLDAWLAAAQHGPRELRSFAGGITRDEAAVQAALERQQVIPRPLRPTHQPAAS